MSHFKYTLRPYQQEASDRAIRFFRLTDNRNGLLVLPTGCHAKGTKILMYDGNMKNVEDIIVGDILVGDDGKPRTVLELHRGIDKLYEIRPIKGTPFVVNGGHILSLYKTNEGRHYPSCQPKIDEISVTDYLGKSTWYKHVHKLRRTKGCDFSQSAEITLNPYFLGLYLGDGCSVNGVSVTTMREEVKSFLYNYVEEYGLHIRDSFKGGNNKAHSYYLVGSKKKSNPIINELDKLGLLGVTCSFKFIPHHYKCADRQNRLLLLAGLLDTDAYYDIDRNMYEYCSKSAQLADDIIFLCRSLGFFCSDKKAKEVNGEIYYRFHIAGDLQLIPTKVEIRKGKPRVQKKSPYVTGFDVKYVGSGPYYGFTVDGNHLYCDGQFFVHHNSGKSLIIADIAYRLDGHVIVFCPSKEIVEQNYQKLRSYGVEDCSIYSASCGSKVISRVTFASIGSVKNHMEDFTQFKYVLLDECHLANPKEGMYKAFFEHTKRKILGLTATPYRLTSQRLMLDKDGKYDAENGEPHNFCMLKFLTRTRPRIFHDVIYQVDISTLLEMGFLAKLQYFDLTRMDIKRVKRNSTGMDYDDRSLFDEFKATGFVGYLCEIVNRLLNPKNGVPRKGILVFTKFIEESEALCRLIPGTAMVSGETPKKERERIINEFKEGKIKVVTNCNCLSTGFDFPELDTVVLARPTMSLAMYYQQIGRAIRPHPDKECAWIVDLCGNYQRFGCVENLHLSESDHGMYCINGWVEDSWKQLTNVLF